MDLCPKFIIEGDSLVLGKVIFHKGLATDVAKVKGGGWFRYLKETDMFVFHGDSHDFGKAKFDDIKEAVSSGKVFSNSILRHNISDRYNFGYDTGTEIISLPVNKTTENAE